MRCVWTKSFPPPCEGVVWNVMFSVRSFQKDISILDEYDSISNWHSTTGKEWRNGQWLGLEQILRAPDEFVKTSKIKVLKHMSILKG